jgi:hypothetical protein
LICTWKLVICWHRYLNMPSAISSLLIIVILILLVVPLDLIATIIPTLIKNIFQAIYNKLVLWNLDKKTFCLVLDNLSANDVCIRELLNTSIKDELPAKGSIFHQRCGCHILNLIVQDGLSVLCDEIKNI